MKEHDFSSKDQRQILTIEGGCSFKKIEVRTGVCAAAILHVRLG
jgi:hypothetical protein